jgi:glutathione peroxidase
MKPILWILVIFFSGIIIYFSLPTESNKHMTVRQRILKKIYPLIMKMGKSQEKSNKNKVIAPVDFYSLKFTLIDNTEFDCKMLKGKKTIIVNTASDCGFTGQYEALEKLYQQHKDSIFILGFPSNDFGNQEKGNNESIASFCKINYGVSFPIAIKGVVIKNKEQQNIYKWLTDKSQNGWNNQEPTWNFCKYVIDENGQLSHFFNSSINPLGEAMKESLK